MINTHVSEVSVFWHIFFVIFTFQTIRSVSVASEHCDLLSWFRKIFIVQQNKKIPFGVLSTLITFIENHFRDSAARHVDDRTIFF